MSTQFYHVNDAPLEPARSTAGAKAPELASTPIGPATRGNGKVGASRPLISVGDMKFLTRPSAGGPATAEPTPMAPAGRSADIHPTLARIVASLRRVDQAPHLMSTLDALVDALAAHDARAVVLTLSDGALAPRSSAGFDRRSAPLTRAIRIEAAGPLGQVVRDGSPTLVSPDALTPWMPESASREARATWAGAAACAAPVRVDGAVVAVVYAEAREGQADIDPALWPALIELCARFAGRRLESLCAAWLASLGARTYPSVQRPVDAPTAAVQFAAPPAPIADAPVAAPAPDQTLPAIAPDLEQKSDAQAKDSSVALPAPILSDEGSHRAHRIARLLVSEVRMFHEADVLEGRRRQDLLSRVGPAIDQARRLFQSQTQAIAGADSYFDREVIATLAGGDAKALGVPK